MMGLFNRDAPRLLKLRVRVVGRLAGLSRDDVSDVIDDLDEELLETAVRMYTGQLHDSFALSTFDSPQVMNAIGDGTFLKSLLDWLSSPEGMAFIKFIFSLFGFMI